MNKHEQIEGHLRAIGYFSSPSGCWSFSKKVSRVQGELDAIKALLQPEPETLASAVLGLTAECNDLSRERNRLRDELTEMTLNYNAAEKQVEQLKADLEAGYQTNAFLREEYTRKRHLLGECRGTIELLKTRNDKLEQNLVTAELQLDIASRNENDLISLRLQLTQKTSCLRNHWAEINALEEEVSKQNKYIEILKEDRRTAFEQGYLTCGRVSRRK